MTRMNSGLERAIRDAQLQLKQMWVLRVRMERMAQAATIGSILGVTAAIGLSGWIIWITASAGHSMGLDQLTAELLVVMGSVAVVLALSGYLWFRRIEALSGAAALELEIETVRSELQHAVAVRDHVTSAAAGE